MLTVVGIVAQLRASQRACCFSSIAALLLGAGSAAAPNCRSGDETLFNRGQTRVFADRRQLGETIYACSARFRRPRYVGDLDYGAGDQAFHAGPRVGARVVLRAEAFNEGGDVFGDLGWWDERTGALRMGNTDGAFVHASAVGADGAMAALYSKSYDEQERVRVGYLCLGKRRLGRLRELAVADARRVSLTRTRVTWTTRAGVPGAAPRDDRPCRR